MAKELPPSKTRKDPLHVLFQCGLSLHWIELCIFDALTSRQRCQAELDAFWAKYLYVVGQVGLFVVPEKLVPV